MLRKWLLLLALAVACGKGPIKTQRPTQGPSSPPAQLLGADPMIGWVAVTPNVLGAQVRVDYDRLALNMPKGSSGEIVVKHKFDVEHLRGNRLQLRANVRTSAPASSSVHATVVTTSDDSPPYGDIATTSSVNSDASIEIHTAIDVARTSTSGELQLVLQGPGAAWFDHIELQDVGPSPPVETAKLSERQLTNVVAFTRAAAAIHYLHPTDEAAQLDWNRFIPLALRHILGAQTQADLLSALKRTFAGIAPTATFSNGSACGTPPAAPDGATRLVRWRHYGLGPSSPFLSFREGRDVDNTVASVSTRIQDLKVGQCKSFSLRARGKASAGHGSARVFVKFLQPGTNAKTLEETFATDANNSNIDAAMLNTEVPRDTTDVEVGIRIRGENALTLRAMSISCDGRSKDMDLMTGAWKFTGYVDLYAWNISTQSLSLRRMSVGDSPSPQDMSDIDVGDRLHLCLPLAVWTDGAHTLPVAPISLIPNGNSESDPTINDSVVRLGAVSAAWGMLSIFYPYFADNHMDWLSILPTALNEAAIARSPGDTQDALAHLLARLHDGHGRVTHPTAPVNGILPITFRRFGEKVVVTGGIPAYMSQFTVGSELLELGGVPISQAYDRAAAQVSAATPGLGEYLVPLRMEVGRPGSFRHLRFRNQDGQYVDAVLPLVERELYDHFVREIKPKCGAELAPGVYYIDFDELPLETWVALLPLMKSARVLIFDFRGYVTDTAIEALSYIIDREIDSPIWQFPRIPNFGGPPFSSGHWTVRPQAPRLNAKIISLIDGRGISAVETVLQMLYDNKLTTFVGETSGGTNGNANIVEVPGGFEIRFTGARASRPDGSTIQGHGITPDQIVHPTLLGVQAGRDEILEAATAMAIRS
jgi:hypothetical protein